MIVHPVVEWAAGNRRGDPQRRILPPFSRKLAAICSFIFGNRLKSVRNQALR
jgi:hypothetical protein